MNSKSISQSVAGVIVLALVGASVAASIWGYPAFLLAMAGGAMSLVIVLMWVSLQQMEEEGEMEFEEALSYAAPSVEEEQKRALLRTLKDLEYELSVGKISKEDYDQVSAEVREKAKRMIALTDEAMKARIEAAEKRIAAHEKQQAKKAKKKPKKEPESPSPEVDEAPTDDAADGSAAGESSEKEASSQQTKEEEARS